MDFNLNQKAKTTYLLVNIEKIGCTFLARMMVKHALIMKRVVFIKIFDWNVWKDLEFDTVLQSVSTRQFRPWFLKIEKYACQIFEGLSVVSLLHALEKFPWNHKLDAIVKRNRILAG